MSLLRAVPQVARVGATELISTLASEDIGIQRTECMQNSHAKKLFIQ